MAVVVAVAVAVAGERVKDAVEMADAKPEKENAQGKNIYLKAQIDLAKHNMIPFEQRTKDQQEVLAEIDGMQDEEK